MVKLPALTQQDVYAGFVGALLVVPQAITFSYLAGMPPEHGFYCAVFVALVMSVLGKSLLIGGPNTAIAMMIGATVLPLAGRGTPLYITYVYILGFMVGFSQLFFLIPQLRRVFGFFTLPAIKGLSTAIGVLLILSSLDGLLGAWPSKNNFFYERVYVLLSDISNLANPYALGLGIASLVVGLLTKRWYPKFYLLAALMFGLVASMVLNLMVPQVSSGLDLLGSIPVSPWPLQWPEITGEHLVASQGFVLDAVVIGFLGLSQSIMVALDNNSRQLPEPQVIKREVISQSVANLLAGLVQSFAGSGSFNRTMVNREMGARTAWAGVAAAFFVYVFAVFLSPLLRHLPMTVVAATLGMVGVAMIQPRQIKQVITSRSDGWVLPATTLVVLFLGLRTGILLSLLFSMVGLIGNHFREGGKAS